MRKATMVARRKFSDEDLLAEAKAQMDRGALAVTVGLLALALGSSKSATADRVAALKAEGRFPFPTRTRGGKHWDKGPATIPIEISGPQLSAPLKSPLHRKNKGMAELDRIAAAHMARRKHLTGGTSPNTGGWCGPPRYVKGTYEDWAKVAGPIIHGPGYAAPRSTQKRVDTA